MQLRSLEVGDAESLENAFQAAGKERAQGLIVVAVCLINSHQARIVNLATKVRLPAIYTSSQFMLTGGLMSYAADDVEQFRGAATYISRLLKGAKRADLPVLQPTKFEFIVSLKAAKQIGLSIPTNVLARADSVIE